MKDVLEIFHFCFQILQDKKATTNENVRFTDYTFRIELPEGSKLTMNRKNDNDVTILMTLSLNFLTIFCFSSQV